MNLLLDLFPVICFFVTFKWADAHPEAAALWATEHFGMLVSGATVSPAQAPMLLATLIVIATSLLIMAGQMVRGKTIHALMWTSLALVVVLGAATVWFHDETFIKWKPTGLYWLTAVAFLVSHHAFGKNLPKAMLGTHVDAPAVVWARLNWAWVVFGAAMGALNLWVAFRFSLNTWVNFKLFGATALMFVFVLGQSLALGRYMVESPAPPEDATPRADSETPPGDFHGR